MYKINISRKSFFLNFLLVFLGLILSFVIAEVILRILPIPGVTFDCTKFDTLVGSRCYPNSVFFYRNERGDFIKRKVNSYGYFDSEHRKEKQKGFFRIGFFGDSYVEAVQVPLENTFFKIVEKELKEYNVECFAFGKSGFSTLQSYLNSKRWLNYFDLDLIVYVFCENDLGDQIKIVKKSPNIPYPILTDEGLQIDTSFREKNRFRERLYFKIGDYLTAHSLAIATFLQRIRLLKKFGAKLKITEEERMMATRFNLDIEKIPNVNDLPSYWPDSLRDHAIELGSAVISEWNREVEDQMRKFVILYIPRAITIQTKSLYPPKNTWKHWLETFSANHNITFVDPTTHLVAIRETDKDVYYGHFTKAGHVAFAEAFVEWFKKNVKIL